jgi:hypothetical protein
MSKNEGNLALLNIMEQSPHVVLLGAGASIACIPKGDKNGKKIPAMDRIRDYIEMPWYEGNKENLEEICQEIDSDTREITFINPCKNIVTNFENIICKTGVSFTETMNNFIQRIDKFYCQSQTFLDIWPRLSSFAYTHIEYKAESAFQWPKTISENTTWDELKEIVDYNTLNKKWFSA